MSTAPSQSSKAQTDPIVALEINNIKAVDLPQVKKKLYGTSRQLRISFILTPGSSGDASRHSTPWSKSLSWNDAKLTILARLSQNLAVEIYAKHSLSADEKLDVDFGSNSVSDLINRAKTSDITLKVSSGPSLIFELQSNAASAKTVAVIKEEVDKESLQRQKLASIRDGFKILLGIGSAISEMNTFAKTGLACVSVLVNVFDKPFVVDEGVIRLLDAIEKTLLRVSSVNLHGDQHLSQDQEDALVSMMRQINECLTFINTYCRQSYWNITIKGLYTNEVSTIDNLISQLTKMNEQFDTGGKITAEVIIYRIDKTVGSMETKLSELQLDTLRITEGPDYEPKKAALPGTRVQVLGTIRTWINGGDGQSYSQAFLLLGKAGVGKSAVAHRIVQESKQQGRLGAFFCFTPGVGPENFFRTISRRLADLEPAYASALMANTDSTLKTTPSMTRQVQELLTKPFRTLSSLGHILIVVDALDECAADRDELIQCLHDNIHLFPRNIRFLITSRPSEAEYLRSCSWVHTHDLEVDASTDSDIYKYVQAQLIHPITKRPLVGFDETKLDDIVTSAEGLFQYAAVVCQEIKEAEKHRREPPLHVHARLVQAGSRGLDALYLNILNNALPTSNGSQVDSFRLVMGWILHAQDRLSRHILGEFESALLEKDSSEGNDEYGLVASVLQPLGALLSGTDEGQETVFPLHSSFRDFLLEESRSNEYCIGPESGHHVRLATLCLRIMDRDLHFNMASLESSYVFNADVPGFAERVNTGVSSALFYSCLHWTTHLELSDIPEGEYPEITLISHFINNLFLFWCEALALKKGTEHAEKSMMFLKNWSKSVGDSEIFAEWTRLLHYFRIMAEDSAPHLYISALSFCNPGGSKINGVFTGHLAVPPEKKIGTIASIQGVIYGHQNDVRSVAFSPDGHTIVSASEDYTIRLWDAHTGLQIGQPLTGHDRSVLSAAFSPDGKRIVSSCTDGSLRVWNTRTGMQMGERFVGHDGWTLSASFSSDGNTIVSTSTDRTIRLWDAHTSLQIGQPFVGPDSSGMSVAFSPDGSTIVAACKDKSICLWDVKTGLVIGQPFIGHEDWISSVAFSPDGSKVVSASGGFDNTVRLWDVNTGSQIGEPFTGHTYFVRSAAFSPDGKQIVSASYDNTVRLWNAETGSQIGQPLIGHIGNVWSAAFSPDGSAIVSGSGGDYTLRLWDSRTGTPIGQPPVGHTDDVFSVAFSSDGKQIVSASGDDTVRLWDAQTGAQIRQPFVGHSRYVLRAVFSQDGSRILSSSTDGTIRLWDTHTGLPIGQPFTGHKGPVLSIAFSPDEKRVVSSSYDRSIRFWDAQIGTPIGEPLTGHDESVMSVSFSPDGRRIVSGSEDNTLRLWDTHAGTPIGQPFVGHEGAVLSAVFSPDGNTIVSASRDESIRLWNAHTGSPIGLPIIGHKLTVHSALFSPDGNLLVSASADKTVRLWDAHTGRPIGQPITGHTDRVRRAVFSPDGKTIASASNDKTIRNWDVALASLDSTSKTSGGDNPWSENTGLHINSATGWVTGPKDELLLWTPQYLRGHILLHRPWDLRVLGPPGLQIGWQGSYHGTEWTKCYVGDRKGKRKSKMPS